MDLPDVFLSGVEVPRPRSSHSALLKNGSSGVDVVDECCTLEAHCPGGGRTFFVQVAAFPLEEQVAIGCLGAPLDERQVECFAVR